MATIMLIGPAFDLKVVRALDRLNTHDVAVTEHAFLPSDFHTSYTTYRCQMRLKPAWLRGRCGGIHFLPITTSFTPKPAPCGLRR